MKRATRSIYLSLVLGLAITSACSTGSVPEGNRSAEASRQVVATAVAPTLVATSAPLASVPPAAPARPAPTTTELPTAQETTLPDPTSQAIEMPTAPADTAPRFGVDGHVLSVEHGVGVWISEDRGASWLHQQPPPDIAYAGRGCWLLSAGRVIISTDPWGEGIGSLVTLDLETQKWSATNTPRPADQTLTGNICYGIDLDGTAVFARHFRDGLWFFVEDGDGYREVRVDFPVSEFPQGELGYLSGFYFDQTTDELVLWSGNFPGDCGLISVVHAFPSTILEAGKAQRLSWGDSGQHRIETRGYDMRLTQVGDEVWYSEQVESYAFVRTEGGCYEPGRWGSGPLGGVAGEFERGYEPRLYPFGDSVVAEVPLIDRLGLDDDSAFREAIIYSDWWIYRPQAGTWEQMPESPAVPISIIDGDFMSTRTEAGMAVPSG